MTHKAVTQRRTGTQVRWAIVPATRSVVAGPLSRL